MSATKKPCAFDAVVERDSNGQCHCRNVLYREWQKDLTIKDNISKVYNESLLDGGTIADALAVVREAFPSLVKTRRINPKPSPAAPAEVVEDEEDVKAVLEADVVPIADIMDAVSEELKTKPKYVLVFQPSGQETEYARKDAAIKNVVRSGGEWAVTYKGKTVAQSDNLL